MSLMHSTRVIGGSPIIAVDVVVDPLASQGHVRAVLMSAARRFGSVAKVDLIRLDARGRALSRRGARALLGSENDLSTAVADALSRENIGLGRSQHRA